MKQDWYNCILEDRYGRDDIKALRVGDKYYDEQGKEIKLVMSSKRVRRVVDEDPEYCGVEELESNAGIGWLALFVVFLGGIAYFIGK